MSNPLFRCEPPEGATASYGALREEGLRLLQQAAGRDWTDYSPNDPGVTILEAFCYSLSALFYRSALPVEELLAPSEALLAQPLRAVCTAPVSGADFPQVLIDRVEGLAYVAWEHQGDGLHEAGIYCPPPVPGAGAWNPTTDGRAEKVRVAYAGVRPLGEDLADIYGLEPLPVRVDATLELEAGSEPDEVLAEAVYRLANWLAPEPRRRPVGAAATDSRSAAEIFSGPLLHGGQFEGEVKAPRKRFTADDLRQQLELVRGVASAEVLEATSGGSAPPDGIHDLPERSVFSLDSGLEGGEPSLRLSAGGRAQAVNAAAAHALLETRWTEHRNAVEARAGASDSDPPPAPSGFKPDSIQDLLPRLYGVGRDGLEPDAPPERAAQAKQLSAYLSLLQHLIDDGFRRLEALPAMFRGEQPEEGEGLEPAEIEAALDTTLWLYGDTLDVIPMPTDMPDQDEQAWRIRVKRDLVAGIIAAGMWRGGGDEAEWRLNILLGGASEVPGSTRPIVLLADHVLLRAADGTFPAFLPPSTVTALLHLPDGKDDAIWQRDAAAVVRANVPAHLAVDTFFVGREALCRFQRVYGQWRGAAGLACPERNPWLRDELLIGLARWRGAEIVEA